MMLPEPRAIRVDLVTAGPLQLLVLGFDDRDSTGAIVEELQRLRESGTVRVIDSLAVFKDAAGQLEIQSLAETSELGRLVGAAERFSEAEDEGWDVLQDIPNDTAAALVLLEHQWAVPLREAIARAGGFRISDGFIGPQDLVEIGTELFGSRRVAGRRTLTEPA